MRARPGDVPASTSSCTSSALATRALAHGHGLRSVVVGVAALRQVARDRASQSGAIRRTPAVSVCVCVCRRGAALSLFLSLPRRRCSRRTLTHGAGTRTFITTVAIKNKKPGRHRDGLPRRLADGAEPGGARPVRREDHVQERHGDRRAPPVQERDASAAVGLGGAVGGGGEGAAGEERRHALPPVHRRGGLTAADAGRSPATAAFSTSIGVSNVVSAFDETRIQDRGITDVHRDRPERRRLPGGDRARRSVVGGYVDRTKRFKGVRRWTWRTPPASAERAEPGRAAGDERALHP